MMKQKLCVVHRGALGDFLTIWPALHAISLHMSEYELYWAGRKSWLPWTEPLGFAPAPHTMRTWVEAHAGATRPVSWTGPGDMPFIIWFGLTFSPFTKEYDPDHAHFIPTIDLLSAPGREKHTRQMALSGLPFAAPETDWQGAWAELIGTHDPALAENRILLFPGAGHGAKQWPLEHFMEMAGRIHRAGPLPAFVLGPVEVERGLDRELLRLAGGAPLSLQVHRPENLERLSALLLSARGVLGNDCGPMHLAGMYRTPGVVLFGPTARRQWSPPQLKSIAGSLQCRPCTATTRNIPCDHRRCMATLTPDEVWLHLEVELSL